MNTTEDDNFDEGVEQLRISLNYVAVTAQRLARGNHANPQRAIYLMRLHLDVAERLLP